MNREKNNDRKMNKTSEICGLISSGGKQCNWRRKGVQNKIIEEKIAKYFPNLKNINC